VGDDMAANSDVAANVDDDVAVHVDDDMAIYVDNDKAANVDDDMATNMDDDVAAYMALMMTWIIFFQWANFISGSLLAQNFSP